MSEVLRPAPRPIGERDLDELVDLCREHAAYERAAFVERADHARALGALLAAEDAFAWVVEGTGELAGFATAFLERSTWDAARFLHMDCLYLRPAYRGRGLGRRLMGEVARTARERGAVNLQWQTPVWNEGAVRFYRRLGGGDAEKQRFTVAGDALEALAQR